MLFRIEQKIRYLFIGIITFSVLGSSILLYIVLRKNILQNYLELSVQYASQQNQKAHLYLSLIAETAKLLINDQDIIEVLQCPKFDSALVHRTINKLSGIQTSNVSLTGITIYGLNGVCYKSESIGLAPNTPPPLEVLESVPLFKEFTTSAQASLLWWVRSQNTVDFPVYDSNILEGLITLALKIFNQKQELIGYLLVDMKLTPFLHFFKDHRGKSEVFVLSEDGEVIKGTASHVPPALLAENKKLAAPANYYFTKDKLNLYISFAIPSSAERIVKVVSLTELYIRLFAFLLLLLFLDALLILFGLKLGGIMAASVSEPIGVLLKKMQRQI
ncbi:cache domain-containing protein [Capillibacterium thermochitinicola]|uniref:Cache domain-containing protein n=1 Tax=Capillibacterium thermochitinicola TaxID=2699427 RepID=A0A8J6HW97_9FIRM|nr:cache domain-containing protein [Capillibacterium thermochitinicola]MBA2132402.1 cache domain-containing protein [Capillibacterium thermochitinicola]